MASPIWVEQQVLAQRLKAFFGEKRDDLTTFGSTVNQTFEAFVFASVINWYKRRGWNVQLISPKELEPGTVKLKFNTRGAPGGYTYALCTRGGRKYQVRHGLRVATAHHEDDLESRANIVVDVAVVKDCDLSSYTTHDHLPNRKLVTFGEAKHMSAFAELVAQFLGMVHELTPSRLVLGTAPPSTKKRRHPAPFLYVSGILYPTARGVYESIVRRGIDIRVHDHTAMDFEVALPTTSPKAKTR